MIHKYKYSISLAAILVLIGFLVWIIIRPSTLEAAKERLSNSESYGEIKGVWQEYKDDLSDNTEWKQIIEKKISRTNLNENQQLDLINWYPDRQTYAEKPQNKIPSKGKMKSTALSAKPENEIASISEFNPNISSAELAKLYNKQGDEKCKAFKNASAPHLYHIANEYYQYAATLTKTNPKVCE